MKPPHDGPLPNPYHGNPDFGGRQEWRDTWFHGSKGEPDLKQGRPPETRAGPGVSWPLPNKLLGTHFSPLHEVAHQFAFGGLPSKNPDENGGSERVPGMPGVIVHVQLRFRDPVHYPTEDLLNLAVAQWASRHFPRWHDEKTNRTLGWNYSDHLGTRRNWHEQHLPGGEPDPPGLTAEELAERRWGQEDPENPRYLTRMTGHARSVLVWHPLLPEILSGFAAHLHGQGRHGITYGNQAEGPGTWDQDTRHVSAIATCPSQIEVTGTEHIAPHSTVPEPHQVTYDGSGTLNEPAEMSRKVAAFHAANGGELPRPSLPGPVPAALARRAGRPSSRPGALPRAVSR